jgi:hypothetical protein
VPELALTLVVPPALLGRAIAVTGAAGLVADPGKVASDAGNLTLRTLFDDDGGGEARLAVLVLELLAEEGIRATVQSSGILLSSGAWRQVYIDGEPSTFRVIGASDEEWNAQLDYLAHHDVALKRSSLSLHQSDDPYRRLLEGE